MSLDFSFKYSNERRQLVGFVMVICFFLTHDFYITQYGLVFLCVMGV